MPLSFDLYPTHIKTVLFLSSIDLSNKLDLAVAIRDASGSLMDGESMLLPIPDDAPAELPRLILNSKNELWGCLVAPHRIEFRFDQKPKDVEPTLEQVAPQNIEFAHDVWQMLQNKFHASAHRIGFVVKQVAILPDAVSQLRQVLVDNSNLDAAHRLEVHVLHRLPLDEFQINRWSRIRALPMPDDEESRTILEMDIDINTLPEPQLDLSGEQVNEFSSEALDLVNTTIETFWGDLD